MPEQHQVVHYVNILRSVGFAVTRDLARENRWLVWMPNNGASADMCYAELALLADAMRPFSRCKNIY